MAKKSRSLTVSAPRVLCDREVWSKLIAYSKCTVETTTRSWSKKKGKKKAGFKTTATRRRVEISGLGIVTQEGPSTFRIRDFLLVPSKGSGASTEFIDEGTGALVQEILDKADRGEGSEEDVANLRLWWHTHPGMGLQWSNQDEKQMAKFGDEAGYPWLISIVTDGDGEYRARLDIFPNSPGGFRLYFDDIEITIEDRLIDNLINELQPEVDEKVEVDTAVVTYGYGYDWGKVGAAGWGGHYPKGYKVNDKRRINGNVDEDSAGKSASNPGAGPTNHQKVNEEGLPLANWDDVVADESDEDLQMLINKLIEDEGVNPHLLMDGDLDD